MEITTSWVKPPSQIGGLDHLAVQAPCINIYGRLLPGITNVTDRARYYSFYPWLIWRFDRQGLTKFGDEFKEKFRRADCLFTLIAERHAHKIGGVYEDHAGAMVGSNTLARVAKGLGVNDTVRLSDYSLRDSTNTRYFKNPMGGLGQYYLGVLRELRVLGGDTSSGVKYTQQIGQVVAERMNDGLNGDLFLSLVESDKVTAQDLDELSSVCPCQLHDNPGEAELLVEMFFARGLFHDLEALSRRRSLQSILDLSAILARQNVEISEGTFRACAYSGGLPNNQKWLIPESLAQVRAGWSIYARNELLSVAIQGLFYALLDGYEESGHHYQSSEQLVDWFVNTPESREALGTIDTNRSFSQVVEAIAPKLPPLTNWGDPRHEVGCTEGLIQLCSKTKSPENRVQIIANALYVLISLAHRFSAERPAYGDLVFEKGYFSYYPINLQSFQFHATNTWPSLTKTEFLRWLLLHWGIDNHLKVALRKLRGQSQSTFRIRPSDQGLEVTAIPTAVHTRPRFKQAVRILKDLHTLTRTDRGVWMPNKLGFEMLKLRDDP